jgi:hypothetical protein
MVAFTSPKQPPQVALLVPHGPQHLLGLLEPGGGAAEVAASPVVGGGRRGRRQSGNRTVELVLNQGDDGLDQRYDDGG